MTPKILSHSSQTTWRRNFSTTWAQISSPMAHVNRTSKKRLLRKLNSADSSSRLMTSGGSAAVAAVDVLRRLKNEEKESGREKAF